MESQIKIKMFQFATIVIVSISIGLIVCDVEDVEQFSGETGMMVGIEALYERFFHDSNGGCEGAPYLSNEFDMTGQTCVTNGQANFGRYYQRDPMEDNKFRRCDTDNSFCMTNENEVCRTSQIPLNRTIAAACTRRDKRFRHAVPSRAKRRRRAIRIARFTISTTTRTFVCVTMRQRRCPTSRATPIRLSVISTRTTCARKSRPAARSKCGHVTCRCPSPRQTPRVTSSLD